MELEDHKIYDPDLIAGVAFDWEVEASDFYDFRQLLCNFADQRSLTNAIEFEGITGWPGSVWKAALGETDFPMMRQDFVSQEREALGRNGFEGTYAQLILRMDPFSLYTADNIVDTLEELGMEDLMLDFGAIHSVPWLKRELRDWLSSFAVARLAQVWDAKVCTEKNTFRPAWYGFRWQLALSEDVFGDEQRLALEQMVTDWEKKRRGSRIPFKKTVYKFLGILLLVLLLVWGSLHLKYLSSEGGKKPGTIAVLACYRDHMGPIIQEMLIGVMSSSELLQPLPSHRIEAWIGTAGFCEPLSEHLSEKLFFELKVDYLLWGGLTSEEAGYQWRGTLMRADGKKRNISVLAGNYRALTDEIGKRCLAFLGTGELQVSAIDLYSSNMNASLLFSEANLCFSSGEIRAAAILFERAFTMYDPTFFQAGIRWAQCLQVLGKPEQAIEVLEDICQRGEAMDSQVLIRAYKALAEVYFETSRMKDLEILLNDVATIEKNKNDLIFFQLMNVRLEVSTQALSDASVGIEKLTKVAGSNEIGTDILITEAWVFQRKGLGEWALDTLVKALAQARAIGSAQKEMMVLGEMARIHLANNDGLGIQNVVQHLRRMRLYAQSAGLVRDENNMVYWLGHCLEVSGEIEGAVSMFEWLLETSRNRGLSSEEVKAGVSLAQLYLRQGAPEMAMGVIQPLELRRGQLTPYEQLGVLEVIARCKVDEKRFGEALQVYQSRQNLAESLDWGLSRANTLNDKGYVLEQMGRLNEAELCYREALDWMQEENGPNQNLVTVNLLRVLQLQGRLEEAQALKDILNKENHP